VDKAEFFAIMGAFPKGVTIVTTLDDTGTPKGLTSNDIASVSAEPPMMLVCVNKTSNTLPALRATRRWVVNFLAAGRGELSNQFASKIPDKFTDVSWRPGKLGMPVLYADSIAYAECTTEQEIDAGDHVILLGRVEAGQQLGPSRTPLTHFRRTYAEWSDAFVVPAITVGHPTV
jgi:flavin reductase (DIM6/NTAB) family NADH-FMN oxidoreductase RutF